MSIAIAIGFTAVAIVTTVTIIAIRALGGWGEVRLRWKLWQWRRRTRELQTVLQKLEGDGERDVEEVYHAIDSQYPGTLEAKQEQLEAELEYYETRIEAIERDRRQVSGED
mgnify:CR=1 FL=1